MIDPRLVDPEGCVYALELVECGRSFRVLRWTRDGEVVTLRDAVGGLERYEPLRSLTAAAVVRHREDMLVSTSVLHHELERVLVSEIVLNRGLREAVLASGKTLSDVAMGCGRTKRDSKGYVSGETSWVSRRIGILRDAGRADPSPWVHTDVLTLIAREGLGCEPRDCEVDVAEDVEIEEHWCRHCAERVTTAPDWVCPWCETDLHRPAAERLAA